MEGGDGSAAEGVASAATEGRGWAMTSRKMQQGAAMQGDEANWVELGQWVSGSHLRFAHSYSVSRDGISRSSRFAKIVFHVPYRIHVSKIVVNQHFLKYNRNVISWWTNDATRIQRMVLYRNTTVWWMCSAYNDTRARTFGMKFGSKEWMTNVCYVNCDFNL